MNGAKRNAFSTKKKAAAIDKKIAKIKRGKNFAELFSLRGQVVGKWKVAVHVL